MAVAVVMLVMMVIMLVIMMVMGARMVISSLHKFPSALFSL
ncbi:hypothetical protein [Parageobacillus thermantarcticus]|nr:hypothetical protein [Parageobacillus thermantarcticus]